MPFKTNQVHFPNVPGAQRFANKNFIQRSEWQHMLFFLVVMEVVRFELTILFNMLNKPGDLDGNLLDIYWMVIYLTDQAPRLTGTRGY
jgi:hypothetical protein